MSWSPHAKLRPIPPNRKLVFTHVSNVANTELSSKRNLWHKFFNMDFPVMPFSRQSRHPVRTTTMTMPHQSSPIAMILVFTCLLNSSHHPACSATAECSGEVAAYKNAKEKAEKVRTKKSFVVCVFVSTVVRNPRIDYVCFFVPFLLINICHSKFSLQQCILSC